MLIKRIRPLIKRIRHWTTHPLKCLKDKGFRRAFFYFSLAKSDSEK
jgi:hypothetical protein